MSIKKIAKEAGVSTATVSRVLNNPGYKCSSEELRERIWKIARELNYMPNEAARNLKKGITNTSQKVWYLDVLMTRTGNLETDPFFSELLRVIESEIHRQGCILMHIFHQPLFSNDRKCRTENIDKVIAQMEPDGEIRSDGLIIIGKCNDNVLKKLSAKYRSIVSVNRNSTNYLVDEVICDGKRIAAMAVHCRSAKCSRAGILTLLLYFSCKCRHIRHNLLGLKNRNCLLLFFKRLPHGTMF